MKIATWNVNSLRVRLEQVCEWLRSAQPDILALQETKCADDSFPVEAFEELGYRAAFSGQPAYNGVAVISREPAEQVVTDIDGFEDHQRRVLGASYGSLRLYNLYVPNGQSVESEKYVYKLDWFEALRQQLRRELAEHQEVVVLGDFNVAPEDRDVHDPQAWEGKVLCSPAERAALGRVLELGFDDAFRLFEQAEGSFSWWDYRAGAFRRNLGLRIDLILTSKALSRRCTACTIDTGPRRLPRPSDHTPVVAEFGST
ncbi:MAG: exodeoxyribonuclease III [Gammaproteobacteria bacterium]|nr:exodeoxyribonuclease III [Gammaproteobacteria bacterium]